MYMNEYRTMNIQSNLPYDNYSHVHICTWMNIELWTYNPTINNSQPYKKMKRKNTFETFEKNNTWLEW